MNISLTPKLENYVKHKVEAGLYNSASEVMREALRLLEERDALKEMKLEALRHDIKAGVSELEEGKGSAFDMDAIKLKARALKEKNA